MKYIVLGGAGDVGSRAVEDLAGSEGVTRVTIADRNTARAEGIAARLGNTAAVIDVARIDADDHDGLVRAMKGYDVAASALGPFFKFELELAAAAIEAGVDYASVCDEWEAAEAALDGLGQRARERGRIVLTGLGASPGLSNVGIRYLADKLDTVRKAEVYVYQPLDAGGGEAVLRHMLHIMTGDVTVWRGGQRVQVKACSETRRVEFPRFGALDLWNMGHAEPLTVPRFVAGIQEVGFFMGYGKGARALVWPARAHLFAGPRRVDLAIKALLALDQLTGGGAEPGVGAVRLDVWGTADGRDQHHLLCGVGQMREVTGLSLSVGTQMLVRRELTTTAPGVYAPEGCLVPAMFIDRMRAKGLTAYEDLAMTRPLAADRPMKISA
jgi:saccharopine dehydrogenase-like NADP-dependent oxidoreductase